MNNWVVCQFSHTHTSPGNVCVILRVVKECKLQSDMVWFSTRLKMNFKTLCEVYYYSTTNTFFVRMRLRRMPLCDCVGESSIQVLTNSMMLQYMEAGHEVTNLTSTTGSQKNHPKQHLLSLIPSQLEVKFLELNFFFLWDHTFRCLDFVTQKKNFFLFVFFFREKATNEQLNPRYLSLCIDSAGPRQVEKRPLLCQLKGTGQTNKGLVARYEKTPGFNLRGEKERQSPFSVGIKDLFIEAWCR